MRSALPALAVLLLTAALAGHSPAQLTPLDGPDLADPRPTDGAVPPEVAEKLRLARFYRKLGYTDKASDTYREVIRDHPKCAEAYNGLGFLYEKNGRYSQAIESYRKALKLRPGWARPMFHIGSCLLDRGNHDKAEEMLRKATEADPADASPRNCLGILYTRTGRLEAAEREYRAAASIRPKWAAPYWNLVLLYDAQGRYKESDKCLDVILEIDPDNFNALYQRVKHLVGRVDYSMAERTAAKLVKLYPHRAAAHEVMGIVHWSRENWEAAEGSFRRALAIDPNSAGAHMGMGHVRLWQKRFDEAEENYRRALAIEPDLLDAKRGLEAAIENKRIGRRVGGGCSLAPDFASASPLGMLQYLAVILPAVLLRKRL